MVYSNGATYTGEWRFNLWHGNGTLTYPNQDSYTGEFVEGKRHGKGQYYSHEIKTKLEGIWKNDKQEGHGLYKWSNGLRWEGEWRDN